MSPPAGHPRSVVVPSRMGFREALQVLRRRYPVVIAGVVLGVAVGWLSGTSKVSGGTTYRATDTLIGVPQASAGYSLDQVALMATEGAVPTRVAARLHLDRQRVRAMVSASSDPNVSTVSITGQSTDRAQAEALARVTGEELIVEAGAPARAAYNAKVRQLTGQVDLARQRISQLQAVVAAGGPDAVGAVAALPAAQQDLVGAVTALQTYQTANAPSAPLATLEQPTASAVTPAGIRAPDSRQGRALLLGGLGLLLGIGAAIALNQLDSRIRTKRAAEAAFGYPVLAEIPPIPRPSQGKLLAIAQPSSPVVEAYRSLRTIVALWSPGPREDSRSRVIVVTSPMAGEGKTTTVAHLAAMLAELGRSVLTVSADFRRPRLDLYFDRQRVPGLTDVLAGGPEAPSLADLDLSTSVRGIRFLSSGAPVTNPGPLLERAGGLLNAARGVCDFVLVDTPPVLMASDAVELARHADGVLLLARAGRTTTDSAVSSAELLNRLEIPVVGVVLIDVDHAPSAHHYYRYRYYSETNGRFGAWRRPADDGADGTGNGNGHNGKVHSNGSRPAVEPAAVDAPAPHDDP